MDIAYWIQGSLDEFPTPERDSGIRTVTAVIAALLVAIELGLWVLLRRLRR